jgi:hypothetical protein
MPTGAPNGSVWLDTDATSTSIFQQYWRKAVVTAGTTITGADDYALTLAYTVGFEDVYLNGVLLVRGVDYTATNGTSIVLSSTTTVGDYVEIITTSTFVAADTYTQSAANAAFPLNTSAFFAGKNKFINGDFGVWQRGTTFTNNGGTYCTDRFAISGSGTAPTVSQQAFTPGSAPVSGYEAQYFLRWDQSSAATAAQTFQQRIEDGRTLAGQTATISFWAKANSGSAAPDLKIGQNFGSGGSASVTTTVQASISFTASWVRYSYTIAVPSASGKTIGAGSYFLVYLQFPTSGTWQHDYWGFQIEAGSVATAFQTASGSLGGELALCQRYFYLHASTTANRAIGMGCYTSSTAAIVGFNLPVTMRVIPTATVASGTDYYKLDKTPTEDWVNDFSLASVSTNRYVMLINSTQALGTAGGGFPVFTDNANSSMSFSAEL